MNAGIRPADAHCICGTMSDGRDRRQADPDGTVSVLADRDFLCLQRDGTGSDRNREPARAGIRFRFFYRPAQAGGDRA